MVPAAKVLFVVVPENSAASPRSRWMKLVLVVPGVMSTLSPLLRTAEIIKWGTDAS